MNKNEIQALLAEQEAKLKKEFKTEIEHLEADIVSLQNQLSELAYQVQTLQTELQTA